MSVNKVILIGRLGKDPETKTFESGDSVSSFPLATSEKWRDKAGNKAEATEWHSVEVWGKLSEIVSQYVQKGSEIYLEGKIKTQTWVDGDGVKRYKTKILGLSLQMIGSKPGGTPESGGESEDLGGESEDLGDFPF